MSQKHISQLANYKPREWFDRAYFEGGKSNYRGYLRDIRFPIVARILVYVFGLEGKRVLDVGSAIPYLVDELRKLGVDAVGFDISDYAVEGAIRERITYFFQADATMIPVRDESFYLVIASELVEHIPRPLEQQLIKELTRVTRRFLLIRTPFCESKADRDVTHVNIHPHQYWITKIESLGFITRWDLYREYTSIARRITPLFYDEFLVFEKISHTRRWLIWESMRRGFL